MTTFDRYVLKIFLIAVLLSTVLLLGLFLIIDFFSKLKPFMEIKHTGMISFILQYYLVRLPVYLLELLPIITLISAMLTITRFMKTNEFLPLLSAGVSMPRILRSILVGGILIVLAMFVISESIVPSLQQLLSRTEKILKFEGVQRYLINHDKNGNSFVMERYDYTNKKIYELKVMQFKPEGTSVITAESGVWHNQTTLGDEQPKPSAWYLYKGTEYFYPVQGNRQTYIFPPEGYRLETSLTPENLEQSEKSIAYYRITELFALIRQYPHQSHLYIQLYNKFAYPFSTMVLLVLGISVLFLSEFNRASASMVKGIGICLVISIGFFSLRFVGESMGMVRTIPPLFATLGPLVLFAFIALFLFRRIKT